MSKIDYPLHMIKAVAFDMDGVLSASTVAVREDGTLQRHSNVKDGFAIQYAVARGMRLAVISGARDDSMLPAYRILGIQDVFFHCSDKKSVILEWMASNGLSPQEVAYVGDDIPDIPAMEEIGLKVCPRDGADEVKQIVDYISPCNGGNGVARDLISQILSARGEWMLPGTFGW